MSIGIVVVELVFLFFLSRALTKKIYQTTLLLTHSKTMGIVVISLLHFPGTVIHELAHLFTATVLGVRTGKLSLIPEAVEDGRFQAGSVMIADTDPFRRYAIGLAPVFAGIIILFALSSLFPQLVNNTTQNLNTPLWQNPAAYLLVVNAYFVYAVSNSMFSSKEDLQGFLPFAITLGVFIAGAYVLGLRIGITPSLTAWVTSVFTSLATALGIVVAINMILFLLASATMRVFFPRYR